MNEHASSGARKELLYQNTKPSAHVDGDGNGLRERCSEQREQEKKREQVLSCRDTSSNGDGVKEEKWKTKNSEARSEKQRENEIQLLV